MEFIEAQNLIFEYNAGESAEDRVVARALDGVNLNICNGSFVAVVGRNGSGKSTFAKCLNGILVPTSGKVLVDGMDTGDDGKIWDIRSRVGMVFQNPDNQIVSSIVEDDVAFGPENLGIEPREIRKRVDEALKAVGMYDCREKGPHMLSGGQKQRVAIAGVIAMKPNCIVFDEPTAMLDPLGREQVMSIIKKLHEEGITIVLITHFMEEAAEAERIVIMDNGRVFFDAAPEEVFSNRQVVKEAGLELPTAAELRSRLEKRGVTIDRNVISPENFVKAVVSVKEGTGRCR